MKFLKNVKTDEFMATVTRTASKYGYKLKKASPTIMIFGAAIVGVAATVSACKATVKAQDILEDHNEMVKAIHETKEKVDSGEMILKEGAAYTENDYKKDLTTAYVQTGLKLAKIYAPAVTMGTVALGCMFGSHHIMTKRNASLTAAYIALDKAFNEYKGRVTDRFGDRVQQELEHNIKAVEVETTRKNEQGVEETVKEYTDVAMAHTSPYTLIYDETVSSWDKDAQLNMSHLIQAQAAANRKLHRQGHLFLNDVIDILDPYGNGMHHTPEGQVVGWILSQGDPTKENRVDFGITNYVENNDALNNFIDGFERSVLLRFNCDGVIIDKI